jgi:hypothetical protein
MLGSLARRERRPLWGTLTFILAVGIGLSLYAAATAQAQATTDTERAARLAVQTQIAPMLQPKDLEAPIEGARAVSLGAQIQGTTTAAGPIDDVTIYSSLGKILYSANGSLTDTRPSSLADLVFSVANTSTQSRIHGEELQTYVPLWLRPGGTTVVVEMSQPFGSIARAANAPWYRLAMALGVLFLATAAVFGLTLRARALELTFAPTAYTGTNTVPRQKAQSGKRSAGDPLYLQPGFQELEEQRQAAIRRAEANEENYRGLQQQFKGTLEELKRAEARLEMMENKTSTTGGDLRALRDQLRDTAERLHKAELDNNALRERLALRNTELDEVKGKLHAMRRSDIDVKELRARVDAAERRAMEMEQEVERIESELDDTSSRFHLTKLSEALRDMDNDVVIEEDDDLYDRPRLIIGQSAER